MARVLLGVTGGIAAYKAVLVMRLLQKEGHEVRVVMTPAAARFITPLTFQSFTDYPVYVQEFGHPEYSKKSEEALAHITLAKWADIVTIAPASANTVAKLAAGIADNLLTSILLATSAKIAVFPAMNNHMYENPATQANLATLRQRGIHVAAPATGQLACGDTAPGKLPEPKEIVAYVTNLLFENKPYLGIKMLITAGPTVENIDPVRYISNYSSGKMGYALAKTAAEMGAEVILVTGPTSLETPVKNTVHIRTAAEMLREVECRLVGQDIFIMAAAVADYAPENPQFQKIKKAGDELTLKLKRTEDILQKVSIQKLKNQVYIGFAAESENLTGNAAKKLSAKKLDMIVANDISRKDIGFNADSNEVVLIYPDARQVQIPKAPKEQIAKKILAEAVKILQAGT